MKPRRFVLLAMKVYHQGMKQSLPIFCVLVMSMCTTAAVASDDADLAARVEALLPPHVGACVMAMKDGKVIFEHAYGVADIESKTPCTPETNFRLASVSKQFTATAIMLLVDRGKLKLDDPLSKFFPGFPRDGARITVK